MPVVEKVGGHVKYAEEKKGTCPLIHPHPNYYC